MPDSNWKQVLDKLEEGSLRSAYRENGEWKVNTQVKQAILDAFKAGKNRDYSGTYAGFVDKDNLPPRMFTTTDNVRMVPGGSSVRHGAFIASGVIIMPPSYVNIGVYIDEGTMIDSHVLVGSCAQIGKRVHLSAGVQIGGVLEPVGLRPVIVEDDCFVGAGAVLVEGALIRKGAVIAPGTILSKSIPVYDNVHNRILDKGSPIPENAVVVPGMRSVKTSWGREQGLSISCPVIIKYRDTQSDASLVLEEALR